MFADTHNVAVAVADAGKREARYLVSCEARTKFLVPVCFSRVYTFAVQTKWYIYPPVSRPK